MALVSFFDDPFDYFRPSKVLDQHFGMGLCDDDFLTPCLPSTRRHHRRMLLGAPYQHRNWSSLASRKDRGSIVSSDKDKFQVSLDVQQFSPEEITVKATGDNTITVEGKHEEKEDEHGYVSRQFVRRYTLPKGHDIEKIQSKLSSDGVLTITAPKENKDGLKEREIPIALTGKPSQEAIQDKGDGCNGQENAADHQKKEVKRKK